LPGLISTQQKRSNEFAFLE